MKRNVLFGLLAIMLVFGFVNCGGDDAGTTTYTVTFNSNGGSNVASIGGIISGATITLPTDPKKDGNTFVAWFLDNNTFERPFTSSTIITDNIIVYAKWDTGNDPDNPYNNNDPKKIIIQDLPNNGNCILMISTSSGNDSTTFETNVFAIAFAAVSGNAGTFDLKIGTAEEGPTETNYTKTGDFYVSLSFETSSVVSNDKIKIDKDTINLQYVEADWKSISFE